MWFTRLIVLSSSPRSPELLSESTSHYEEKGKRVREEWCHWRVVLVVLFAVQLEKQPLISSFRVSKATVDTLRANGFERMFPIQAKTFDIVYDGFDLIARARTGTGKTLSFVLPVIERLLADTRYALTAGRGPRVIVMAPTRELAKQDYDQFNMVAQRLTVACIYGGVPYEPQESLLRRGVDVLVGTPGRILDHIERGNLKMNNIQYVILDEADEMLNIGFKDDIERLLKSIPKDRDHQTLLYSATIPQWVKDVAKRFLKPTHKIVDLVGHERVQTSQTVRHLALEVPSSQRTETVSDLVKVYGIGKSCIIFCDTKNEANAIALSSSLASKCQVLHGDIAQAQREVTLASFREGKFPCLVATNVAARGLDIAGVELIIQLQPPKEIEAYIHRSGRTGRAGRPGTSIILYNSRNLYLLKAIEKKAGIVFQRIGRPQVSDIYRTCAEKAMEELHTVSPEVISQFKTFVHNLSGTWTGGIEEALAAALAYISGVRETLETRSLLGGLQNHTTILLTPYQSRDAVRTPGFVIRVIAQMLGQEGENPGKALGIREIRLTKSGGAVADLPTEHAKKLVALQGKPTSSYQYRRFRVSLPDKLPELVEEFQSRPPVSNDRSDNKRKR